MNSLKLILPSFWTYKQVLAMLWQNYSGNPAAAPRIQRQQGLQGKDFTFVAADIWPGCSSVWKETYSSHFKVRDIILSAYLLPLILMLSAFQL